MPSKNTADAEAWALIAQVDRLLAGEPPEGAGLVVSSPKANRSARLVEAIGLLCPDDPLPPQCFDDFTLLWAWVKRQALFSWEVWDVLNTPADDFQTQILDACPDVATPGADASDEALRAAAWLAETDTTQWVAIGHGHDGHNFLFLQAAADAKPTVWRVDNATQRLAAGCWQGTHEILAGLVIEDMLRTLAFRHPAPAPALPLAETLLPMGGCLLVVVGLGALAWWLFG